MDVLPGNNNISTVSSQPAHQIPAGGLPHSTAAGAAQGNDADRTVAHSATERSTSTHLLPSTSLPGAGGHQLNAVPRVSSSDGSDIPSSSPTPVLDDIPVASPRLPSDPLSDHAPSGSESQPVILVAAPPAQSVFEPEWCAAVEGESSTEAATFKDEDASSSPLVSYAEISLILSSPHTVHSRVHYSYWHRHFRRLTTPCSHFIHDGCTCEI